MVRFCLTSLCVSLRVRLCTRVCVRTSCHHTVSESPGAGCFTGTIWQEECRAGDSARDTASPCSTFPLKDEPCHLDGGLSPENRHGRTETMETGKLKGADHSQIKIFFGTVHTEENPLGGFKFVSGCLFGLQGAHSHYAVHNVHRHVQALAWRTWQVASTCPLPWKLRHAAVHKRA